MTELDIRMVIEEIEAWSNGERGSKLTWAKLERIFPFTRQTMHSKTEIMQAYTASRYSDALIKRRQIPLCNNELEINRLKSRIRELEDQVSVLQRQWLKDFT